MAERDVYETTAAAKMDYPEHEKTYSGFLSVAKWGTIIVAAIMVAMAVYFFTAGGILGFIFTLVAIPAIAYFLIG